MEQLTAIKGQYTRGEISKLEYYTKIYGCHKVLFAYPELIRDSKIKKIEINGELVIFDLDVFGHTVRITSNPSDYYATGLNCLNSGSVESQYIEMLAALMGAGIEAGVYEPRFCMLDVGANLGYYTLSLLKKFSEAVGYAFEPILDTFSYLRKNIALNGLGDRAVALNLGLSNTEGDVRMYFNPGHSGASSLLNIEKLSESCAREAKLTRLDSFAAGLDIPVSLIKCDVEGAEKLVLEGGLETLKKDRPVILCEMMRKWAKVYNYHPNDTIKMLSEIGYACFRVDGDKLINFPFMDEETQDMNFIFLHEEKHRALLYV